MWLVTAGDKQLYTVLEQQQAQIAQGNLMGSDHTYVIPQAGTGTATQERRPAGGAARRCALGLSPHSTLLVSCIYCIHPVSLLAVLRRVLVLQYKSADLLMGQLEGMHLKVVNQVSTLLSSLKPL